MLNGSIDVKLYVVTFQNKNMICKASFLNHGCPCHPLKILKQLKKEKNGEIIFPQIFRETLGALVRLLGITKA